MGPHGVIALIPLGPEPGVCGDASALFPRAPCHHGLLLLRELLQAGRPAVLLIPAQRV